MNLSLPQMIGDTADLEARIVAALAGLTPNESVLHAAIEGCAKDLIANTVAAQLAADFEIVLETQDAVAGERNGGGVDPDEWESQVDDAVCKVLEDGYRGPLGAGYIGGISVDTRLHEPGRVEELAREIAAEYAKEIVKRDRETIHSFVSIKAGSAVIATPPDANEIGAMRSVLLIVLATYIRDQGDGLDVLAMADDLDLASDADEGLSVGAMQRLASRSANTAEVRNCFKAVRRAGGASWADDLMRDAMVAAASAETALAASPVVKKERAKRKTKAEKLAEAAATGEITEDFLPEDGMSDEDRAFLAEMEAEAAELGAGHAKQIAADPAGVLPVLGRREYVQGPDSAAPDDFGGIDTDKAREIMTACKEILPMSEKDLAALMGFSRATLNNITAGKSKLSMTPEQRTALASVVNDARARLDAIAGGLS